MDELWVIGWLFNDLKAAEQNLAVLRTKPDVLYTVIEDPQEEILVEYWATGLTDRQRNQIRKWQEKLKGEYKKQETSGKAGLLDTQDRMLTVKWPIRQDGQILGYIEIFSDLRDLSENLHRYYWIIIGLLVASLALATLLAWMNNSVHATFTHVFMPFKFTDNEAAQGEIKRYNLNLYRKHLERIQGLVEKANPWLFGDRLSVVDIYALVLFRWGGLGGIDPDTLPAYKAYVERVAAQPSVAAALAREGAPLNMYKKPA